LIDEAKMRKEGKTSRIWKELDREMIM